jgi:hypothetical protein
MKQIKIQVRLDDRMAKWMKALANKSHDGNLSSAVREIIRERMAGTKGNVGR